MLAQTIALQNSDGSFCRRISQPEASRLEREFKCYRLTGTKRENTRPVYRLRCHIEPSNSGASSPEIREHDLRALFRLADNKPLNRTHAERLVGHGLISEVVLNSRRVYDNES